MYYYYYIMLQRYPNLPVTISGGGDIGGGFMTGGRMGVASTASRGWAPWRFGLTGVELLTLLTRSVPGATLSSRRLHGCTTVPNFLLGLDLAGVPVM